MAAIADGKAFEFSIGQSLGKLTCTSLTTTLWTIALRLTDSRRLEGDRTEGRRTLVDHLAGFHRAENVVFRQTQPARCRLYWRRLRHFCLPSSFWPSWLADHTSYLNCRQDGLLLQAKPASGAWDSLNDSQGMKQVKIRSMVNRGSSADRARYSPCRSKPGMDKMQGWQGKV